MVSFDSFYEKYVGVAKPSSSKTLNLNLVAPTPASFDRNEAMLKSKLPHQWHDNVVRLVASYVREGKSDQEIHAITDGLTCSGYTIPQTRSDVQIMINGARQKGFDKESQTLEFQKHDQPFLQKFAEIELKPIDYLIQDLIPKRGLVEIFGEPGCGKSFLAIDMGCSVATGRKYHGFDCTKGCVVYLAGEGHRGIIQRGRGWFGYHDFNAEEAPLYVSRHGIGLRDQHQLEFIIAELDKLKAIGSKPDLIIIDTLARNFGGGDENSTKDMSEFVAAVDELINRYDTAVLIVHHSGLSERNRSRGNSALKAALDAEYKISKSREFIHLECTKMKDMEEIETLHFFLDSVTINGKSGEPIETVVPVRRTDKVENRRATKGDLENLAKFREAYIEVKGEYNSDLPIHLHLEEWRPIFYRRHTGDNKEAKRKAFERTRKNLVKKGMLSVSDDVYTFAPRPTGHVRDIIKTENQSNGTDTDTLL